MGRKGLGSRRDKRNALACSSPAQPQDELIKEMGYEGGRVLGKIDLLLLAHVEVNHIN